MKKIHLISTCLLVFCAITPLVASASFVFPDLTSFVSELLAVNALVLNILITLAFIAFFWGVAKFILVAGNDKSITEGKEFMKWGIIALFILLAWKAIIIFASGQVGFSKDGATPLLPSAITEVKCGGIEDCK